MKNFKKITLLSIITLSILTVTATAFSAKAELEKCAGIVKKGSADGKTVINGVEVEWIYVPAGACAKLVGGKLVK